MKADNATQLGSWRGSPRGHFGVLFYTALALILGLVLLIERVVMKPPSNVALGFGIVFLFIFVLNAMGSSRFFGRRVIVTAQGLKYPTVIFRSKTIPIDEIIGIGAIWGLALANDQARVYGRGWGLAVWSQGRESPLQLRQFFNSSKIANYQFTKKDRPLVLPPDLPSEKQQWDAVSVSRPGRVAKELYDLVLSEQGPSGRLNTDRAQLHQPLGRPEGNAVTIRAIWSPSGEFRRFDVEQAQQGQGSDSTDG